MKRFTVVALVLLLAACASGRQNVTILEPLVSLVQLVGPSEQSYPRGQYEVKFGIDIINKSSEPITLRRLEIRTIGGGGAYIIRPQDWPYNTVIPGNKEASLERWVKAIGSGSGAQLQAAPVTVRMVVFFDTPGGAIQKVVISNIGQYPGSSPG